MNRIIKFRVWDIEAKGFSYSTGFNLVVEPTNIDFALGCCLSNKRYKNNKGYEDYPIQQFTGLKDKNNKEIYEGDIIKFVRRGDTHGPEAEHINAAEVWYSEEDAQFVFGKYKFPSPSILGFWWYSMADDLRDIEVIGNVFENGDLIK